MCGWNQILIYQIVTCEKEREKERETLHQNRNCPRVRAVNIAMGYRAILV